MPPEVNFRGHVVLIPLYLHYSKTFPKPQIKLWSELSTFASLRRGDSAENWINHLFEKYDIIYIYYI